jgi:hypothetical protein
MHFITLIDIPAIYSLFRMALSASASVSKETMADACLLVFLFSIKDIQLDLITGFKPLNILISSSRRSKPS